MTGEQLTQQSVVCNHICVMTSCSLTLLQSRRLLLIRHYKRKWTNVVCIDCKDVQSIATHARNHIDNA